MQTYPLPSDSFLVKYYKKQYRENIEGQIINKKYIKTKKTIAKSQYNFIKNFSKMDFKEKKSILEIGCGTGELLKLFKIEGWDIKGIEPDYSLSEYARNSNKLDVETSIFKLDNFLENRFDIIALSHVFEHLANPIEFLKQIESIMEENSIVFIELPNDNYKKIETMIRLNSTSSHLYFYNIDSLRQIFKKNGFKEIFICTVGIRLNDLIRKLTDLTIIKYNKRNIFRKLIPYIRAASNKVFHSKDVYSRNLNCCSDSRSVRVAIRALFKKI